MQPLNLKGRVVGPHKAVVHPSLGARTVLTNSPWTFVSLWLKRKKKKEALFYWEQAYEFYKVSIGLPNQSAPLLLYYCYMNAIKALLIVKGAEFNDRHGVKAHNARSKNGRVDLSSEEIKIARDGILPGLSNYYNEADACDVYSLKQLLSNMVFIHRTYCLTYTGQSEMFLPLAGCGYVYDEESKEVFFRADFAKNVELKDAHRMLPSSFKVDLSLGDRAVRSTRAIVWQNHIRSTSTEHQELVNLNRDLRKDISYINGSEALWYLKSNSKKIKRIDRQLPTLILAAMHRLSEICRYQPLDLASYLSGQKNWLLSEFIQMSSLQFVDEVASELTGEQFMVPNVRAAV